MLLRSSLVSSSSPSWENLQFSARFKCTSNFIHLPRNPPNRNFISTASLRRCFISYCSPPNDGDCSGTTTVTPPPVVRKRKRYRKQYPGENKGIVEEMRFVAMRLRPDPSDREGLSGEEAWEPALEGFLKFLVDSKLVFDTLDRVVNESDHVAYAYFRKTGMERTVGLSKDLEWFREQGHAIPEPGPPGVNYSKYLEEIAEKCAPSFLCHFYNVYFAHITGGQVIVKQVSENILEGRELEFSKWDGDVSEMLKDMREKLNKLGDHWSRDEKNKCLREAAKSFKFSGQIVRLIVV
ncbi:probable inactive heme oxygenase 2, chloroplastic [Aristolochia californica]|uniref:probable inactive heme oxygenase 2, chloroplastic n=1 Tax=Aristolochia californica TaxID=171875 RepID=UPI0035D8C45D